MKKNILPLDTNTQVVYLRIIFHEHVMCYGNLKNHFTQISKYTSVHKNMF